MFRVVARLLVALACMAFAPSVLADEPAPCGDTSADPLADDQAFTREMERFARGWALTARLVAEREEQAFDRDEARYAKLAELTRALAEKVAAESEREFERDVALYLRKRELTRALTLAHAQSATSPAREPSPSSGAKEDPEW